MPQFNQLPSRVPRLTPEECEVVRILTSGVLVYCDRATRIYFIVIPINSRVPILGRRPRYIKGGIVDTLLAHELIKPAPAYTNDKYIAYRSTALARACVFFYKEREHLKVHVFKKVGGKPSNLIVENYPLVPPSLHSVKAAQVVASVIEKDNNARQSTE